MACPVSPSVRPAERSRHPIDPRLGSHEQRRDLLGDWSDELPPGRKRLGELVCERREQPAVTALSLVEVAGAEPAVAQQREQVAVDVRADGFHQVERERVAAADVGVHDRERRVEPDDLAGEPCFGFDQGVEIVQDRPGRVDSQPRPAAERRGPPRRRTGRAAGPRTGRAGASSSVDRRITRAAR
jgi:hypothetical protein